MKEGPEESESMPRLPELSGPINQVMDFGKETLLLGKFAHVALDFECMDETCKA